MVYLLDFKRVIQLDVTWAFELFNMVHSSESRPPGDGFPKQTKFWLITVRTDFDAPVWQVPNPAIDLESLSFSEHEPPEPHALHSPRNDPTTRGHPLTRPCSP